MKKGLTYAVLMDRIQRLGPDQGGVFSYGDLSNLISGASDLQNSRIIQHLVRDGVLFRIQRGFYTTANPDLWVLACRLKPEAYISMDSVLAQNALVGSVPARSVSAVYLGRKKTIESPAGIIRYFSIQSELVFGVTKQRGGVCVADSEKAYLDMLYFYMKGARFVFDPLNEVRLDRLKRALIKKYLKCYKNPKFVTFVEGQFQ